MKRFLSKVRQQSVFAFFVAIAGVQALVAAPVIADTLDDAIRTAQMRPVSPLVPRETILKQAALREVSISPDGEKLAYIQVKGSKRYLWLVMLDSGEKRRLFASKLMNDLSWSSDSQYLYLESSQGIAAVPLDRAASPEFVINLERDKEQYGYGVDHKHSNGFFVSLLSEDRTHHILYRVLPSGEKEELYSHESRTVDFVLNSEGEVAVVRRVNDDEFDVIRVSGGQEQHLFSCSKHDYCSFQAYDEETDSLYMRAFLGGDLVSLYRVNLTTGEKKLIHEDPIGRHDMREAIFDHETGRPVLASYMDDYLSFYGLTADIQKTVDRIGEHFNSKMINLSPSQDFQRWLIMDANPDRSYPLYYVYDVSGDSFLEPLAEVFAGLQGSYQALDTVALRVPVHYTVSDGMRQQGYVTLPNGLNPATVPLVVMPHGGPWGRTRGGFDDRVQFLANRGYAVFEPNFRASTGFGKSYVISANKDFGDGRVQQDILDGMEYILARGVGDREKLGMFGHSFGGFSTLNGLTFTPDLFKVGVAGAPPVDLAKSIKNFRETETSSEGILRTKIFQDLAVDIDDPDDVERIASQSPDRHWEKVTAPLYIWAGEKDRRVNILNVREYALRLHTGGKKITLMVEPNAPHGPREDLHREAYFYMLERAFAQHLGGRLEEGVSAKLTRYLPKSIVLDVNELHEPQN